MKEIGAVAKQMFRDQHLSIRSRNMRLQVRWQIENLSAGWAFKVRIEHLHKCRQQISAVKFNKTVATGVCLT